MHIFSTSLLTAVSLAITTAIYVGIPYLLFRFAQRILRAVERRPMDESQAAEMRARLLELEERVADLTVENASCSSNSSSPLRS